MIGIAAAAGKKYFGDSTNSRICTESDHNPPSPSLCRTKEPHPREFEQAAGFVEHICAAIL